MSYNSDPWATAAGGVASILVDLATLALTIAAFIVTNIILPVAFGALLLTLRSQEAMLDSLVARVASAAGLAIDLTSPIVRASLVVALYTLVAAPAAYMFFLIILHAAQFTFVMGAGMIIGVLLAIAAALLNNRTEDLGALRFWEEQ